MQSRPGGATLRAAVWIVISSIATAASAAIPSAHVYHNHMPNFWPFYAVNVGNTYQTTPVGAPIRYAYDGQVINLKNNPPPGYSYYLPAALGGTIMPHDDLVSYYSHDAKTGAYQYWPQQIAGELRNFSGAQGQIHVTMSGAVVNNVDSLQNLGNVPGYGNPGWGLSWRNAYGALPTTNGYRTLDLIHFTGHHSMGPLVGSEYFLKDLIYQNVTLAQPYFLGSGFRSSRGFFPTELGFSDRLIPTLSKLGIQWSVIGNNHFSRTLKDYPYATYDANGDTLTSPPNRADLRNTSTTGAWVAQQMAHEQQVVVNKYPFASTPHWVRYVDPATGAVSKIAGVPVSQNGSWLEGWEGAVTVDEYQPYAALEPRQFFVVAHDGDNSGGRAGSFSTWQNGYGTTCSGNGYCLGIDEYLQRFPIPPGDVQHVQDGSWIDTRDSSSDPTWYHWRLPFLIWQGQFPAFNAATGMNLSPKLNLNGTAEGATVSLEHGWHYLERNFALLQAALNYAKTAEQIWLDDHPNHWSPTTTLDTQVTHAGNQLNPWMMSFPIKGNPAADYAGGANPAELAWYFLLPAMDSGFGYYDENKDDNVKPTLAFNNSLYFSKLHVQANATKDRTGPSVWWPQRYPYNPGSVNASKAEGWTVQHYNHEFAIYTYAYDVSNIASIQVRIRPHTGNTISASDDTYKVYDPAAMVGKPGLSITPANVGAWTSYPMQVRDLRPVMNGVSWMPTTQATMQVLPAQEIGNLYYAYFNQYRNQLLDYYIEATDSRGNVTRSEIQQVYVGAGTYRKTTTGSGYAEDVNGTIAGVRPFLTVDTTPPVFQGTLSATNLSDRAVSITWQPATDNVRVAGYQIFRNGTLVGSGSGTQFNDSGLTPSTTYSYQVLAFDAAGNQSSRSPVLAVTTRAADTTAPTAPGTPSLVSATASSIALGWTAATDNYGVSDYLIYRNGTQVGTTTGTTYTDSGLQPSTAYSYTVRARDAAGNLSATSAALQTSTAAGNVATVYYRAPAGWTTVNLHYSPNGGTWTAVPGVAMTLACTGWYRYSANLGAASGLAATFNNGAGVWDNNNGNNYALGTGLSTVQSGSVGTGVNPCDADIQAPSTPTNLTGRAIDSNSVSLAWSASTDNVGVAGYRVYRGATQVASVTGGAAYVDNGLTASTAYSYSVRAYDAAGNLSAASASIGVTTPAPADTQAPSVPAGLAYANLTSTSLTLSWAASTDNVGVATYLVLRNGVQVATTAATSYANSGLSANTAYAYTVKAQDAAGNTSAASTALNVTTPPLVNNTATVYYKSIAGWTTVNIHYAPNGGSWTTVPGVAMGAACTGWWVKVISLGAANGAQVTFNNGSGAWDSRNGANYPVGTGLSRIENGVITTTDPCLGDDSTAPTAPSALSASNVTMTSATLSWSASTDNVGVVGYRVYRGGTQIGTTASPGFSDSGLSAGSAYAYTVRAYDAAGNLSASSATLTVNTPLPGTCQVSFTIANANTVFGQNLYVVGNVAALGSWSPGAGFALTIQGSGANVPWSGTITLPAGAAIQYKYVKWNGSTATWESNQATASGNREFTLPVSCASTVIRNDGNFKF
ncbi:MAG: alpha-amylase [Lysobacteraceae bacterium]|nr:MAG: alpha-amylase [Xanthomonadaceae bacterium]